MTAAALSRILPVALAVLAVLPFAPASIEQAALAAEVGPPMLDINKRCGAQSPHSATAMSECIVAESEARSEVLQNWSKYSDDDAEKCIKFARKAKRLPYSALAKCLTAEAATLPATHKPN